MVLIVVLVVIGYLALIVVLVVATKKNWCLWLSFSGRWVAWVYWRKRQRGRERKILKLIIKKMNR